MFFKKIKQKIKFYFPFFSKKLISFRDTSRIVKIFFLFQKISPKKNVHGKIILNHENNSLNKGVFLSYNFRPKFEKNTFKNIDFKSYSQDSAIIIQGPITNYENFVIETIKIYHKIFPKTLIILSTWENEINNKFLEQIKNLKNLSLITSKKIKTKYNVNLQILSTSKAIESIKKKKLKFTLKTRTDCRIYNPNSFNYLKSLMNTFKVGTNPNIKNRILSSSIDTRIFRVYGLSDICLFGLTDDLKKYFHNELYEEGLKKLNININNPIINETAVINEIFLCARFLKNTNNKINWTLNDWWHKCRELFCIFDARSIDLFWYKYHWKYEQRFTNNYTSEFNQSLQFADWLNIYNYNTQIYNQSNKEKWHLKDGSIQQKN